MIATFTDLKDKTVLITGATRGIGKEIAKSLASQGMNIVFNHRNKPEIALELEKELVSLGANKVTALNFDITDFEQTKDKINNYLSEHGAIQCLVNNAGISKDQLVLRVKPEDIYNIINTNLIAVMNLTNLLSKNFLRAKDVSIVHMSSVVGLMGNTSQTNYAASKAGIIGYSKSLAKELASRKVRSNVICPGFIQTEMTEELSEKAKELYLSQIPLGEMGQTKDVSNLTSFLLSSASSYITGEVIKVDGGLYI
jgi:3-oxoacyl-[acyl-carrier protein] reductase